MRRADFTTQVANDLVKKYGSESAAARVIQSICRTDGNTKGEVPSLTTVRLWINHARQQHIKHSITSEADPDNFNKVAELIGRAGVPKSAASVKSTRIKSYPTVTKEETVLPDGSKTSKTVQTTNFSVDTLLTPEWAGPKWPLIQPAKAVEVKYVERPALPTKLFTTTLVVPDMQVGFLRDLESGKLVPIHDPEAIQAALEITAHIRPDKIVHIGDALDMTEWSRFLQHDEFHRTTQPSVDECSRIMALFRSASGERENLDDFIPGNHERRAREYIQKNARAAYNLRPAMKTPKDWPAFTIPWLLNFDKLKLSYAGEWPGGEVYIQNNLRATHDLAKKTDLNVSTIYGHLHRVFQNTRTIYTRYGMERIVEACVGCLCKVGTRASKLALMRTNTPSNQGRNDWQNGLCVVTSDGKDFAIELIQIENGRAIYRDRKFSGAGAKSPK